METKIAVLGDQHIPFMDKQTNKACMELLRDIKPNKIILVGDLVDNWQQSKFEKDPDRQGRLKEDLEEAYQYLLELRDTFPKASIIYLFGNHESRMRKCVWSMAPELNQIVRLEGILRLKELKVKYYRNENDFHREGILLFTHGTLVSQDSALTARRMLKKYGMSIIHGHSHRLGSHYRTDCGGTYGAWENGCLCKMSLAKDWRMGYPPNWQSGLSLVFMSRNKKRFIVNQILIYRDSLLWGGKVYGKQ